MAVVPVYFDIWPLGLQAGDHRVRGADRLQIAFQQNGRAAIVAHLVVLIGARYAVVVHQLERIRRGAALQREELVHERI